MTEHSHQRKCGKGFAENDDNHGAQHGYRLLNQDHRIEQHTDGDKEQHRKRVPQWQGIVGGAMAQFRLVKHHTGEERAERKGDVEQFNGAKGDTERQRQHSQRKQLPRTGRCAARQDPRHNATANQHHQGDKRHHFADCDTHIQRQRCQADVAFFKHSCDSRQQYQR